MHVSEPGVNVDLSFLKEVLALFIQFQFQFKFICLCDLCMCCDTPDV